MYNGDGKRIKKIEAGEETNYFYQNDSVLATSDNEDKLTSFNIYGDGANVISTMRNTASGGREYFTYNKDVRGSTSSIVDSQGNAKAIYYYNDFGNTTAKGNFQNEICYTGGIYDDTTELYYLNARYYNPEDGNFMSQDIYRGEYTNPATLNFYGYCGGNPINYIDPSGHIRIPQWIVKMLHWYNRLTIPWITRVAIDKFFSTSGSAFLNKKGYTLSATMYRHSFRGITRVFNQKDIENKIERKIKNSSYFESKVMGSMKKAKYKKWKEIKKVNFTKGDLHYALGKVFAKGKITKSISKYKKRIAIHVNDTYDFTEIRTVHKISFSNAANDLGTVLNILGIIKPYHWKVNFEKVYRV